MVPCRPTVCQVELYSQRWFMKTLGRKVRCTWEALWSSPRPKGAWAKDLIKQGFPEVHGWGTLLLRSP